MIHTIFCRKRGLREALCPACGGQGEVDEDICPACAGVGIIQRLPQYQHKAEDIRRVRKLGWCAVCGCAGELEVDLFQAPDGSPVCPTCMSMPQTSLDPRWEERPYR